MADGEPVGIAKVSKASRLAGNWLPIGTLCIPIPEAPSGLNMFFWLTQGNPRVNPGLSYLGPPGRMTGAKRGRQFAYFDCGLDASDKQNCRMT
jgi:hypothetical protein